ncbi:hypothetical protein DKX38_020745 [Salix brachista]|uniref:MATH domain-containing protein n=1 Tax=Salix brachista TaxID=2182728 RepID=A0A5N5K679_9ROSI|nr:hypothetical protein DKX38_020745 [Salix brachista]
MDGEEVDSGRDDDVSDDVVATEDDVGSGMVCATCVELEKVTAGGGGMTYKNHPVKRFHEMKTEWGFDQFLPLKTFKDSSKGYLVKDCCVFGAEVFVIKPSGKREVLSMLKKPANGFSTWKIQYFSKLDKNSNLYKTFTAGGRSWQIKVYPGGYGEAKGNSLSVYLGLADVRYWFTSFSFPYGFHEFMPLGDLHQVSKGYLLNDTLIVEAEFLTLSVSKRITRSKRDLPPTHCSLKIESFSLFLETKDEKYEGGVFEAGGYKCDASNGYLINYCCSFGAMISVIKPTRKWKLLSTVMKDFFKSDKSSCFSKAFTAGGFWRIKAYPKGNSEAKGDSPSVYLELVEAGILTLSVSKLFS